MKSKSKKILQLSWIMAFCLLGFLLYNALADDFNIYKTYEIDMTQPNSGVTTVNGNDNPCTIKDFITYRTGTTEQATFVFKNTGSGVTSGCAITTVLDLTNYSNITFEFRNGAMLSGCASGVTFPAPENIIAGQRQQIFASGVTDINFAKSGPVYANWWQTNTTPGTTDMSAAITAMVNSEAKVFYFNNEIYAFSGVSIANNQGNLLFQGIGSGSLPELRFTPTSGNAVTFLGESDDTTFKNLYINSPNSSTGYALVSNDPSEPIRHFKILDCYVNGFLKGVYFGYGVLFEDDRTLWTGQGKAVAGGCGIELGESASLSWNLANLNGPMINSYLTGVSCSSLTNSAMYSVEIGQCTTGLLVGGGIVNIFDGYFESNTTAINAAGGYVYGNWVLTGTTNTVTDPNKRVFRNGYQNPKVAAYVSAAHSVSGTSTVPYDAEIYDGDGNFSSSGTTGYFTAPYDGFYFVSASMGFTATAVGQFFLVQILKNDTAIQSGQVLYHAAAAQPFGGMVGPFMVYCAKNDRLAISVSVSAVMAVYSARIDVWGAGL